MSDVTSCCLEFFITSMGVGVGSLLLFSWVLKGYLLSFVADLVFRWEALFGARVLKVSKVIV